MSETIVWRFWRLRMIDVCSIGYPRWSFKFLYPPKHYGLLAEIETPKHSYEIRYALADERAHDAAREDRDRKWRQL